MNDESDEVRNGVLVVVAGIVALVVAGVIALAISTQRSRSMQPAMPIPGAQQMQEIAFAAPQVVVFEADSDRLSPSAQAVIDRVAEAARSRDGITVVIKSTRRAGQSDESARRRAEIVRHALEANGVTPRALVVSSAAVTGDEASAMRVTLSLR